MSINVQLYWKTKIYIFPDAPVWVVHRWVQHSHFRCWHRKEVHHISNLLFCTVKFNVCNRRWPINITFLLWILHSKKSWWQQSGEGTKSFWLRPWSSFMTRPTQIVTLFMFGEQDRSSMRAGAMLRVRANWRYLDEGCYCDPLCTESWVQTSLGALVSGLQQFYFFSSLSNWM